MQPSRRLNVELLEDRCVPSATTFGSPWPDPTHLTLSFAPDGTSVLGHSSNLFQTLKTVAPTATWEREILRAFQTWAVQTNINIGVVSDNGAAFGTPGAPEGDPRFGDIRIAGFPMPAGELAVTSPFDFTAGTWSGDAKLNTASQFSIGGAKGVDLYTAMLHEAAHSFGLPDNNDPTSAVVLNYAGPVTGLGANDIANIQALYGARNPDPSNNGTFATATPLTLLANSNTSLGIQTSGDINSLSDVDVFRFQAPSGVLSTTINLQTAGISLLDARVTVYDSLFRQVASAVATDPLNNNLTLNLSAQAGGDYYIKVQSGSNDVFGIGSYKLEITSQTLVSSLTGLLSGITRPVLNLVNDLLPLNTTFLSALLLPPVTSQTNSPFNASFRGSINSFAPQEYFRVQAPQPQAGQPNVMTVMAWGTDSRNFQPRVDVYDANQKLVASNVVANENGTFVVQVPNAVAGASYYVKLAAANPNGPNNTGGFLLAVQFGATTVDLQGVTQGTLGPTQSQAAGTLTIQQGSLMHFVVSAQAADPTKAAAVRFTVLDNTGAPVLTTVAYNGKDPVSVTGVLGAGTYTVLVTEYAPSGSALPALQYSVTASRLDEPISPQPSSNTAPAGSPPPSGTSTSASYSPSPSSSSSSPSSGPTMTSPPPSSTSTTSGTDTSANSSGTTTTSPSGTTTSSSSPPPSGTTSTSPTSNSSSYYYYQSSGSSTPPQDPYSSPYKTS